jgi:hypothetical protein
MLTPSRGRLIKTLDERRDALYVPSQRQSIMLIIRNILERVFKKMNLYDSGIDDQNNMNFG